LRKADWKEENQPREEHQPDKAQPLAQTSTNPPGRFPASAMIRTQSFSLALDTLLANPEIYFNINL
jgi:hypothetical protein